MKKLILLLVIVGMIGSAQAALTATTGMLLADATNTARATGTDPWFSEAGNTADYWDDRGTADSFAIEAVDPVFGAINKAYQAQDKDGAVYHTEIITTISGLTEGDVYQVWVLQSDSLKSTGGTQAIDAAFVGDDMVTYGTGSATDTGLVSKAVGPWNINEALLGTATVTAAGEIQVRLDATTDAERTVYHGLAYTLVPEPATMLLLGLGGLVTLRRRK